MTKVMVSRSLHGAGSTTCVAACDLVSSTQARDNADGSERLPANGLQLRPDKGHIPPPQVCPACRPRWAIIHSTPQLNNVVRVWVLNTPQIFLCGITRLL